MQGECNVDAMSICVRYEFSIFSNNFVSFVISFHPRALLTYAIKFGTFFFFSLKIIIHSAISLLIIIYSLRDLNFSVVRKREQFTEQKYLHLFNALPIK